MNVKISITKVAGAATVLLACLICFGCVAPGEGKKAQLGKEEGNRVVEALAKYRAEHGKYPDGLDALVPRFIGKAPLVDRGNAEQIQFFYIKTNDDEYRLIFKYIGPGTNECSHYSSYPSGSWKCSGAY